MTDIRNYPNPLLQAFSDQFNLGVRFDANGVPTFNGNKVSPAQFQSFFDTALTNQENLYRLMPDGSVTFAKRAKVSPRLILLKFRAHAASAQEQPG